MLSPRAKSRNTVPLVAAFWANLVAAYLYFAATYDRSFVIISSDRSRFEMARNEAINYASAVAVTDARSIFGLTIPIIFALCPLAMDRHRRGGLLVAGALTLGVCLVWPLSIGALYLPTALLLLLSGASTNADPAPAI